MKNEFKDAHVEVYAFGLCHQSVCTDLPRMEVESYVNAHFPSGTRHGWKIAKKAFKTGEPNGKVCEQDSARHHYLMVC